jgi:hypothetical protein
MDAKAPRRSGGPSWDRGMRAPGLDEYHHSGRTARATAAHRRLAHEGKLIGCPGTWVPHLPAAAASDALAAPGPSGLSGPQSLPFRSFFCLVNISISVCARTDPAVMRYYQQYRILSPGLKSMRIREVFARPRVGPTRARHGFEDSRPTRRRCSRVPVEALILRPSGRLRSSLRTPPPAGGGRCRHRWHPCRLDSASASTTFTPRQAIDLQRRDS